MVLDDLLAQLMTDDELATSRVGIVAATDEVSQRIGINAAETVAVDPLGNDGSESVCELVVVDGLGADTVAVLPTAVKRMTRDGILVAVVPSDIAAEAARMAMVWGTEWVAILEAGATNRRYLVAAAGIHPVELGPVVEDHVVHHPGPECLHVPQSRADRARRRVIRREGRTRLIALAQQLRDRHGDAVSRVVEGIETLVGDRRAEPNAAGARPAIFVMPGIAAEAWPDPARWPRLGELMSACERHSTKACTELRAFAESRSFGTEAQNGYNIEKFQMKDLSAWRSIKLFDEGRPTRELPSEFRATRALLDELAPHISGEVVLLRLAPMTSLPPHYDDNDYQQTTHIGLMIPPQCGIRVGGETRTWNEDKSLVFSPAFLHEVWNRSERPRDVLLIDTWHMDLTNVEIEALTAVRQELKAMRKQRNSHAKRV